MALALPEPDRAVVRQRDAIVQDLRRLVPPGTIIADEEGRRAYETDALTAYRRMPLAVALPAAVMLGAASSALWPRGKRQERVLNFVPMLARSEEQLTALTIGILKYSRDLAFTAASAYADAAEARGTWDSRMEASVVDAVVRGDTGPELLSRAAALNWDTTAPATVVVGNPAPGRDGADGQSGSERASQDVRDIAARHGRAALTDVHGTWLVAIVSGQVSPTEKFLKDLLGAFADGPVVIGPTAPMLTAAYHSASEAISGMNAVAGWRGAPRPVLARELLPERALMGDASAIVALHTDVMRPLADAGPTLTETLDAYLDCGGAIEACARKLFVHPNTVRYRLKRITDFTGRDPTQPRDAYVLRVAATVGQLNYPTQHSTVGNNQVSPPPSPVRGGTVSPSGG